MPLPAAYTEADLAQFSITALGDLATTLGWDSLTPVVLEAVNDALVGYFGGTGLIAEATDVPKLRAVARVAIWRAVVRATAGNYRFSADQMSFDRQQVHEHAVAMVDEALNELTEVDVTAGASLVLTSIVRPDDPYGYLPDELRVPP